MKNLSAEQQTVLLLLRKSLWKDTVIFPEETDWNVVNSAAKNHAIVPLVYDGAVAAKAPVPPEILQEWKTILLAGVMRNEQLLKAQDALLKEFAYADIPAAILKGSSISQYYPQPRLRILGDIDVLVGREDVSAAKEILEAKGYTMCESDHDFHIGYSKPGAYVELHYEATKLPDSPGGAAAREITDRFLEDLHQGTVDRFTFPVLSEPHQAMMLLLHMVRHMFDVGIGLRQLCDWAVYLNSTDAGVFMEQTLPMLSRCGLLQYAKTVTGVCVHYLGLHERHLSWCGAVEYDLCQAFLADVFRSGNMGAANEAMGSFFTDSSTMGRKQSSVAALASGMNRLAYQYFPVTKRFKILLPLAWVYLPMRRLGQSMLGLRPKKSAFKVVMSARRRRELYEMLDMFELESGE